MAAPSTTLRRDAAANRVRIVDAAHRVFARAGLDAGVDEIAREAGVGMGTLYRRFPTKEALVAAVVESRVEEIVAAARRGLEHPDAWSGLRDALHAWAAVQAAHRGFLQAVAERLPVAGGLVAARAALLDAFEPLLARAQAAGAVRDDLAVQDLPFVLAGIGRRPRTDAELAPDLWERYFALALAGLRAPAAEPLPVPPPPRRLPPPCEPGSAA